MNGIQFESRATPRQESEQNVDGRPIPDRRRRSRGRLDDGHSRHHQGLRVKERLKRVTN